MDEWTVVIMVLVCTFMLSSAGLFGYWLKLRNVYRHMPQMADQMQELQSVVDELRSQLESQTAELHERLDFTERVLTDGVKQDDEASLSTPV